MVHSDSLQLHFLALFKSLHVKIPGYVAKSLGIHHHLIMTHTSSGRCVRGASMFIVFWLNYQVGLRSTDYFAPHPFLKIYVSNMPPKHLNFELTQPPKLLPVLALALEWTKHDPPPPPPPKKKSHLVAIHTPLPPPAKKEQIKKITK